MKIITHKIPSPTEQVQALLANRYVHPFRKHMRAARMWRTIDSDGHWILREGWTNAPQQDIARFRALTSKPIRNKPWGYWAGKSPKQVARILSRKKK